MKKSIDYLEFRKLLPAEQIAVIEDRGLFVKKTQQKTVFMVHDYFAEVTYKRNSRTIKEVKPIFSFDL
jgi:hypothetical protein